MAAVKKSNEKYAKKIENSHELELRKCELGPIGNLIGCTDSSLTIAFSSLTIAFVLLIFGFFGIFVSAIGMIWNPDVYWNLAKMLGNFELTIATYVMGKKSNS